MSWILVPAPRRPNQEPTISLRDYQGLVEAGRSGIAFVSERMGLNITIWCRL